jgi:hypothetical protein
VAAYSFLSQPFPCKTVDILQQATQEITLQAQLIELSLRVSTLSGIDQHFEYGSSTTGGITIINNKPEDYIHIFGLTESKRLWYEMRELKDIQFLPNYYPSDSLATVIPNPIEDPGRYALVALRYVSSGSVQIGDLTDLASVAAQPLTPKEGLRYMIFDRQSLRVRDQEGSLHLRHSSGFDNKVYLYIVEKNKEVHIMYDGPHDLLHRTLLVGPGLAICCSSNLDNIFNQLNQYLRKKVTRQELLSQVYRRTLVYHAGGGSTYKDRVKGIDRLFRNKKQIEINLAEQRLRFEDGVWKVDSQRYTTDDLTGIIFGKYDNKMVITEVFPHN